MSSIDLPPWSTNDVIIDIFSSTTGPIDREQLKLKFRLAIIDDVDKKISEIKVKSDQIRNLFCQRIDRFIVFAHNVTKRTSS